jgi:hypothetical protein
MKGRNTKNSKSEEEIEPECGEQGAIAPKKK